MTLAMLATATASDVVVMEFIRNNIIFYFIITNSIVSNELRYYYVTAVAVVSIANVIYVYYFLFSLLIKHMLV